VLFRRRERRQSAVIAKLAGFNENRRTGKFATWALYQTAKQ
jgi:hypothetical protein